MLADNYTKPLTIQETISALKQPGSIKIIAGGTDLIIALSEHKRHLDWLIDISDVAELRNVMLDDQTLRIGSAVTFREIQNNALILKHFPLLAEAASKVGAPTIRSRATIGGNVANSAVAADSVPVLLALDARASILSPSGSKVVPVRQIVTGINQNNLQKDELIAEFILPLRNDAFMAFEKIGRRRALAISRISLAILLDFCNQKEICSASLAVGTVGKTAYRVTEVEEQMVGKVLTEVFIDEISEKLGDVVARNLAGRSTTPYKRKIAAAVMSRALTRAMER